MWMDISVQMVVSIIVSNIVVYIMPNCVEKLMIWHQNKDHCLLCRGVFTSVSIIKREEWTLLHHIIRTSQVYSSKKPNSLYVDKEKKNEFLGTKKTKDKNRVTLVVVTADDSSRLILAVLGKSNKPACFDFINGNSRPPYPYCDQKNACFDDQITM